MANGLINGFLSSETCVPVNGYAFTCTYSAVLAIVSCATADAGPLADTDIVCEYRLLFGTAHCDPVTPGGDPYFCGVESGSVAMCQNFIPGFRYRCTVSSPVLVSCVWAIFPDNQPDFTCNWQQGAGYSCS